MDLTAYRNSPSEQARISDLVALFPRNGDKALDVGARDGYISKILADRFGSVTALDLETPDIRHPNIHCVKGDVTRLAFRDGEFDLVVCAEVLEHIPPSSLVVACQELARVAETYLVVGVPYRQNTRVGRTTCNHCGGTNPPWGHVNTFDERRLLDLFSNMELVNKTFVGSTTSRSNPVSSILIDWAGSPYGTYSQEEPCIHCDARITDLAERALGQKALTKIGYLGIRAQQPFVRPRPKCIHILLRRKNRAQRSVHGAS